MMPPVMGVIIPVMVVVGTWELIFRRKSQSEVVVYRV